MPNGQVPWYKSYFCEEYWQFAEHEYDDARNEIENNFLKNLLASYNPTIVVDVGCGLGRHTISLAQFGYEVHGIDVSEWALSKLKKKAGDNKKIFLYNLDILTSPNFPIKNTDAIISIQSFGWGTDFQQFRLLSSFHSSLNDNGLLVLDITNPMWILKNYSPIAEIVLDNVKYEFNRKICPETYRSKGTLGVTSGSNSKVLYHDIRLYNLHEICALIKKAGFKVDTIYSDFNKDSIDESARYYQIVAIKCKNLEDCLAIATHKNNKTINLDVSINVDLATSNEEKLLLECGGFHLVDKNSLTWDIAKDYSLKDPFQREKSLTVIKDFIDQNITKNNFFWGAGVLNLIYQLSNVFDTCNYAISTFCYPDFSEWLKFKALESVQIDYKNDEPIKKLINQLTRQKTDIIILENPDIFGNVISEENFNTLNKFASLSNIIIVVDESNINYYPISDSLVKKIHSTKNLIVLRGFSKAYYAGGLRVGLLFCSENLFPFLANMLPPLQASSLSIFLALEFIKKGDLMREARKKIAFYKKETSYLLTEKGFNVYGWNNDVPWLIIENSFGLSFNRLVNYAIVGKYISTSHDSFIKLCVPLSTDELKRLKDKLGVNV